MKLPSILAGSVLALALSTAHADINIGVTLSATGPAASLGIPEKNTFALLPTTVAGQKVNYIVLDDASDTTTAVKNARKLISENKVDLMIGSSTQPNSLALIDVVNEAATPLIALSPIEPAEDKLPWVFRTPQSNGLMASALFEHMEANHVKTLAFIGFADAYGEAWWREVEKTAAAKKIKIVATERYNRTDTSVTGQVLKIVAARPDAVLIGASGTPAALPQSTLVERGYKGRVYQTHAVANKDFLRVGGKNVEGAILPVGPVLVAEQLPDANPSKKVALDYIKKYEAANGVDSRSTFGAHAWDAALLMQKAIPEALKIAKPGSPEFRKALRDALEATRDLVGTHGVFNMGSRDHGGFDQRSRVLVKVEGGAWKLLK